MKWLYALLIAAAAADVVTRAIVPATVTDVSPWVNAVGYGWGFVALKAVLVVGIIGMAEAIRRVRGIEAFAGTWPAVIAAAWAFGAASNIYWLANWG